MKTKTPSDSALRRKAARRGALFMEAKSAGGPSRSQDASHDQPRKLKGDAIKIAIQSNNCATNDPCAICGTRTEPGCGPEYFRAGSWRLACERCARTYDPELYAMLQIWFFIKAGLNQDQSHAGMPASFLLKKLRQTAQGAKCWLLLAECGGVGAVLSSDDPASTAVSLLKKYPKPLGIVRCVSSPVRQLDWDEPVPKEDAPKLKATLEIISAAALGDWKPAPQEANDD